MNTSSSNPKIMPFEANDTTVNKTVRHKSRIIKLVPVSIHQYNYYMIFKTKTITSTFLALRKKKKTLNHEMKDIGTGPTK